MPLPTIPLYVDPAGRLSRGSSTRASVASKMISPQTRGARSPARMAVQRRRSRCRCDVEAEHHPALVVLGDVAVRHPAAWVGDVEQDVDGDDARRSDVRPYGNLPALEAVLDEVERERPEAGILKRRTVAARVSD